MHVYILTWFFPKRSFSPTIPNDDSVYLAFVIVCQFVAFVMIPIKFMERTPNMKMYALNKCQDLGSKNWILDNFLNFKNKFSKNRVTTLHSLIV